MKVVFGLLLLAFATVAAEEEVLQSPIYDYHRRVGIQTAARIKAAEESGVEAGAGRIVGGHIINIADANCQVGLILQVGLFNSVCGGTLIGADRFITAAHCINDGLSVAQLVTAVFGSNWLFVGGIRHSFSSSYVVLHYGYNPVTTLNDIAVARMPVSVTFSDVIQPVPLPRGPDLNDDFSGRVPRATGYGITSDGSSIMPSQLLSAAYLPIISRSECDLTYGILMHESKICTMGVTRGICSGDTGGPLVDRSPFNNGEWILIGVSTFYHPDGCELNHPLMFTRITSYVAWIDWVSSL